MTILIPPSPMPSDPAATVKITPIPGAPDSMTVIQLEAASSNWNVTSMTGPAGKIWHVKIHNQDEGINHNFTVASGKTIPERIFQSDNFLEGTFVFDIPALPAGSYLFICTLHPALMTGTLNLK